MRRRAYSEKISLSDPTNIIWSIQMLPLCYLLGLLLDALSRSSYHQLMHIPFCCYLSVPLDHKYALLSFSDQHMFSTTISPPEASKDGSQKPTPRTASLRQIVDSPLDSSHFGTPSHDDLPLSDRHTYSNPFTSDGDFVIDHLIGDIVLSHPPFQVQNGWTS